MQKKKHNEMMLLMEFVYCVFMTLELIICKKTYLALDKTD